MKIFTQYLKQNSNSYILMTVCSAVFLLFFSLAGVPVYEVGYGFLFCFLIILLVQLVQFIQYSKKHKQLEHLKQNITYGLEDMPVAKKPLEQDYQEILERLYEEKSRIQSQTDLEREEMTDYYAMWAHQIKTPIAAMRLLLQAQPDKVDTQVETELFKIEQYVEMVLSYLRIGSSTNDLVVKEQDLEPVVRNAVKKYARLFIQKKISLQLDEINAKVVTDEKWLSFVIEQVLSNALKYTKSGSIRIYIQEEHTLVIQDSGIGISKEDLPRIFEKGFTGYNGREDRKSTGIGLYLCKKVMDKLGHQIMITSEAGKGTKVLLELENYHMMME